jgi:hypothetical protein
MAMKRQPAAKRASFYEPLEGRVLMCYEPHGMSMPADVAPPMNPPLTAQRASLPHAGNVTDGGTAGGTASGGAGGTNDFNIVWTNRGQTNDNFAATFGGNAGAARAVVDAVIQQYERIISSMNWTGAATQHSVNISMRNQAAPDFGGQCPPGQVGLDPNGTPVSATIFLGRGNDTNGDNLGDGGGWYLDPTPNDWAEFPNVVNAFAGTAPAASPIANQRDFYSLIAHEMGHAMGMTSGAGSDWRTFLGAFAADSGVADAGGAGNLWAYSSAAVGRAVLTDSDGGGAGVIGVHSAVPGQNFNFNAQSYTSAADVMNNSFQGINGRRLLVSNLLIGMIDSVSGYDNVWPEQFGSFYTSLDTTTGQLTLRGGAGTSADEFSVLEIAGGGYQITVDVGTDVAGTGPTDAFVSTWTDAQVSSIVIDAGAGNDWIEIRTLGANEPVTIDAGTGNDEIRLAIGDFDSDLLSNVVVVGDTGTDQIWVNDIVDGAGSDTYTLSATTFGKPGRSVTFSGIEDFDLLGSGNNDVYNIESFTGTLTVDDDAGNDTFNITQPGGDLDALDGRGTLIAGTGSDTINLYDQSDTGADTYLFDSSTGDNLNFTKTGGGAFEGMLYSGFETLLLEANGAGNTINAVVLTPTDVTFDGNGGNDTVVIDDTADLTGDSHTLDTALFVGATYASSDDPTVVTYASISDFVLELSNEDNTVNVNGLPSGTNLAINGHLGSDVAQVGGGDLGSNVLGDVHFNPTFDGRIVFNDSTNPSVGNDYDLDGGTFVHAGRTHTFVNVTEVELEASNSGDNIDVRDTFSYDTVVRGNGGTDLITLGGGSVAFMDNVTVWGGDGADELRLDDTSAFASTTFTVDQGAGLPFVDLFNGNIRATYDSIDTLRLMAGPHADAITSIAMPMSTSLRIAAGAGDDAIDVRGHPTLNSNLFESVSVDGGAGLDTVEVNTDGQGGARAHFNVSQDLQSLQIGTSGRLTLNAGNRVIETNSATMPTSGFELDLTDGMFVRRGIGSFNYYRDRVATGYNGGAWNGDAINSSFAEASPAADGLGIARADQLFNGGGGIVNGVNLAATDIVIRHTLYGDANLDGTVNLADFNRLAANFGSTSATWAQGNFNYDTNTNLADFNLLSGNFGQSV